MAKESLVVNGATLQCTAGSAPATLMVSGKKTNVGGAPLANIQDYVVGTNIPTFGTCSILSSGCAPTTAAPWSGGCTKTKTDGALSVKASSTLTCGVGGTISVTDPGQTKVSGE